MQTAESDAKFKYCPLLKTGDDKMKMCQTTMCMMWRWLDREREVGYCGLAGKPGSAEK
ncbi:hypothetical protein [Pseudodesulfovibrio tunisiensis]|uniref:hypothetical protein n=1 Tax=Pseudodesulfovibrio tunisiensis TaxID=463192 RepID=UPI001FB41C5F|nr:hypothetical protein [Pseudodesulfovibrio tunisiensis]